MISSFPLQYPAGWTRTKKPERARFNTCRARAITRLLQELRLMGAKNVIISSNVETYTRGGVERLYANQRVEDTGVAVYFDYLGKQQCIPCDRWDKVSDNVQAVNKTVSALRGLERWGAKEMVNAAFSGFKALPEKAGGTNYFEDCHTMDEVIPRFRELAKKLHPDRGGDPEQFAILNSQYQDKKKVLNG